MDSLLCSKSKTNVDIVFLIFSGDNKEIKAKAKGDGIPQWYFKLGLMVKDLADEEQNQTIYRIFVCTMNGRGKEFLNVNIDKGPTDQNIKELKAISKKLLGKNVVIDCIVEDFRSKEKEPVLVLCDTAFSS